jgi:hypothetical protein
VKPLACAAATVLLAVAACSSSSDLDPIKGDWRVATSPQPNRFPELITLDVHDDGSVIVGSCGSKDALKVDKVSGDEARYRIEFAGPCLLDDLPVRMSLVVKHDVLEVRVTGDPGEVPYVFKRR